MTMSFSHMTFDSQWCCGASRMFLCFVFYSHIAMDSAFPCICWAKFTVVWWDGWVCTHTETHTGHDSWGALREFYPADFRALICHFVLTNSKTWLNRQVWIPIKDSLCMFNNSAYCTHMEHVIYSGSNHPGRLGLSVTVRRHFSAWAQQGRERLLCRLRLWWIPAAGERHRSRFSIKGRRTSDRFVFPSPHYQCVYVKQRLSSTYSPNISPFRESLAVCRRAELSLHSRLWRSGRLDFRGHICLGISLTQGELFREAVAQN